jgi:hypothetical protein
MSTSLNTMTDYKRLCAELVDAIDSGIPTDRMHLSPLMLRVRDALAEPEPEGPTRPIPVSERLPGDQLCWWYEPDEEDGYGGMWTLLRIRGGTACYSHWLPADALPLPD